jgi:hypothetical protein
MSLTKRQSIWTRHFSSKRFDAKMAFYSGLFLGVIMAILGIGSLPSRLGAWYCIGSALWFLSAARWYRRAKTLPDAINVDEPH